MDTEREQAGNECASCASTGFIWLGYLQRMAVCPVCRSGRLDVKASEQEGRSWALSHRTQVFDHYGQACACCGAKGNLSIDHVNGDGREHRTEVFGRPDVSSIGMYRWLVRNGFPDGFQTLCTPCNSSKASGKRCRMPHPGAVWPRGDRG